MLDLPLDAVTEPRPRLISKDEAGALMAWSRSVPLGCSKISVTTAAAAAAARRGPIPSGS